MLSAIFDNGLFDEYHTITSLDLQIWLNKSLRAKVEDTVPLNDMIEREKNIAKNLGKPLAYRILPEMFEHTGYDPDMFYLSDVRPYEIIDACDVIIIDYGYKHKTLKNRFATVEPGWFAPRY